MCPEYQDARQFRAAGDRGRGIRASALQFVRKLSGANRPSRANEAAFNRRSTK